MPLRSLPLLLLPSLLSAQLDPVLLTTLDPRLKETSGLLMVNGMPWTHGDSGNPNSLYLFDPATGKVLREVVLENASNVDWEALTTDGTWVYVGDFGNNRGNRMDLRIYRFPLEKLLDEAVTSAMVDTIAFAYADQTDFTPAEQATNRDCEAFIAKDDSLFLFTKNWVDFHTHLYVLPAEPGEHLAVRRDTLEAMGLITAASHDPERGVIALLGYTSVMSPFVWRLSGFPGNDLFRGQGRRASVRAPLVQTEGIAWVAEDSVLISSEGNMFGPPRLWGLRMDASLGIDDGRAPLGIGLRPNPASGPVHVTGLTGRATVRILNEQGAVLMRTSIGPDGGFSVEGLAPDAYTVEVSMGVHMARIRLVVVR